MLRILLSYNEFPSEIRLEAGGSGIARFQLQRICFANSFGGVVDPVVFQGLNRA